MDWELVQVGIDRVGIGQIGSDRVRIDSSGN